MSFAQWFSGSILLCTVVLLAVRPDVSVAVAVVSMVVLFVSVSFIEKKQSNEFSDLSAQVKDLRNKVEMLLLNKGFGR